MKNYQKHFVGIITVIATSLLMVVVGHSFGVEDWGGDMKNTIIDTFSILFTGSIFFSGVLVSQWKKRKEMVLELYVVWALVIVFLTSIIIVT